jgi:hypothetical protein
LRRCIQSELEEEMFEVADKIESLQHLIAQEVQYKDDAAELM